MPAVSEEAGCLAERGISAQRAGERRRLHSSQFGCRSLECKAAWQNRHAWKISREIPPIWHNTRAEKSRV